MAHELFMIVVMFFLRCWPHRSIASVKESADWSPGSGEDGFDAGLGGGLGGGVLRDALDGAALGSGLAA